MPRHLVIGNGKLLMNLDQHSLIRDIYYPFVGQLNHVGGYRCPVGIWVNGHFSWLHDPGWNFSHAYLEDSLVTEVIATHHGLGVVLTINDAVHQRDYIYLKRIHIKNLLPQTREIRLFFNQDLVINETEVGDTAVYYPANHTVFHYKKDKYFMFNGTNGSEGIFQYTTGVKRFHNAEGTWKDAEDGHLMGNSIAQGSVDSTISLRVFIQPNAEKVLYYWMTVGKNLDEVKQLDAYVRESHPGALLNRVKIYWQRWVNKQTMNFGDLNEHILRLYKLSLLIVRTQTDANGAIIAANDTDILQHNRDHYSYMWPRDGALVAYAMSMAGYQGMIHPFFKFCSDSLTSDGYLQHKYNPDGTVGSSWHPYFFNGKEQLPIQEDETALVLFAMWQDFKKHGNLEMMQQLYSSLVRKAAKFLANYIETDLGLPKPSYDLWEERYGIYTFTCSAVYAGLIAASNFANLFGDDDRCRRYRSVAERIKRAMLKHLWNEKLGRFVRGLSWKDGKWTQDTTLESSLFGLFEFGVLPADDERVVKTMQAVKEGLAIKTAIGGIARYHHDYYFQRSSNIDMVPGNPWIICTLWVAEWEIERAKTLADLEMPRKTLEWVVKRAMPSGILAEQLDPFTGGPVSVAPLTWSHATFVLTVCKYQKKYHEISGTAVPDPTFIEL